MEIRLASTSAWCGVSRCLVFVGVSVFDHLVRRKRLTRDCEGRCSFLSEKERRTHFKEQFVLVSSLENCSSPSSSWLKVRDSSGQVSSSNPDAQNN